MCDVSPGGGVYSMLARCECEVWAECTVHMLYTVNTQQPVLPSQSGNNWSLGHCETQPGDTCELPSSPAVASFIKSSRGAHLSLAKVIFGYLCEYFRVPTLAAGSAQNNLESDIITRV